MKWRLAQRAEDIKAGVREDLRKNLRLKPGSKDHSKSIEFWAKEREFIENVMNARFNFMVASVALTIGAIAAARGTWLASGLAAFGFVLVWLLGIPIYRAYAKLLICTEALGQLKHPAGVASEIANQERTEPNLGSSSVSYIGYGIRRFLLTSLVFVGWLASPASPFAGQFRPEPKQIPGPQGPQGLRGPQGPQGAPGKDGVDRWLK